MFQISTELKEITVKFLESLPCGLGDKLAAKLALAWNDPIHIKKIDETEASAHQAVIEPASTSILPESNQTPPSV